MNTVSVALSANHFGTLKSKAEYILGVSLWPIFKVKPYDPDKDSMDSPAFLAALRQYEEADGIRTLDKADREIFRIAFAAGWRARARA